MLKLLVIADDFTGALDTGVQFSRQGIQTLVSTETVVQYNTLPKMSWYQKVFLQMIRMNL